MVQNQYDCAHFLREVTRWEFDDPEQTPTYQQRKLVNLGGIVLVTPETAEALELEEA